MRLFTVFLRIFIFVFRYFFWFCPFILCFFAPFYFVSAYCYNSFFSKCLYCFHFRQTAPAKAVLTECIEGLLYTLLCSKYGMLSKIINKLIQYDLVYSIELLWLLSRPISTGICTYTRNWVWLKTAPPPTGVTSKRWFMTNQPFVAKL